MPSSAAPGPIIEVQSARDFPFGKSRTVFFDPAFKNEAVRKYLHFCSLSCHTIRPRQLNKIALGPGYRISQWIVISLTADAVQQAKITDNALLLKHCCI